VHIEYVVRGWEALDHDLADTVWEHWEAGGSIDPREADYDGEAWMGEVDGLAERAADVARKARGGRSARASRRADAREKRQAGGKEVEGRGRAECAGVGAGGSGQRARHSKREREQESTVQCVRRLVVARWEQNGGDEARLRDVWTDAGEEGVTVREVSSAIRSMDKAGELMESEGCLYRLM